MEASKPANGLATTLDDGDVALGILDTTYSPTLVATSGELGADFVWLGLEYYVEDPWDTGQLDGEIDQPMALEAVGTVRSKAVNAGVHIARPGFGMDDVNKRRPTANVEPRERDRGVQTDCHWLVRYLPTERRLN